ncbi:RNA polymerase sigma factor FliA [Colwellia sp. MB3u-28]|uniref:RNA polymerase sigma factor FliA n=1 Tax=unclassified Colwellia TaxID=196834 RepID=UPI0015F5566A|nr:MULTISPECIES: RNA polymerase sigma factor FliA [unclassified Colwellia]MBA6233434.1 RNA polymerase sigma factor FliA [Colwellia sp. MB02u-7]MBA6236524.1 RNA polymerase sigma factor FliA [Colwellia sp. MB02u-11]MBA6257058.1 RNA polymerase sigma factor FliA [Colwellia sp. MB3u-28]MBA6260937.1 RNA polymerase sigma factor FliA [Colwellia sp. MB3u-41]MBA6298077.1 RNA polymerase sigma factor FliA [Colwellia sp. MB3u-22]
MVKPNAYSIQTDKSAIIAQHTVLVKRIAYHLLARLPASVQVDDLIQSGMIGLLEASNNFDHSKGASFETFAGIRIRGAMLDEIRRGDWTPRSVHKNSRMVSEAIKKLEADLGRDVTDIEVAEKLDISLNDYHHILSEVSTGKIIGIEDLGVGEDSLTNMEDVSNNDPYDNFEKIVFKKSLSACISTLPEREALVLSLYYDEELNLREIGQVLDVSESRVSQIHSQAMHRLKGRMQSWQS